MGKRRRYQKKPHFCYSDTPRPCSSRKNISSEMKSVNEDIVKPYSSNSSTTGLNSHASLAQVYQNGMGRSILLRHARHHPINHYSHQALRSNVDSINLLNNNTISLLDEKFFCNLANRWHTHPGCQPSTTDGFGNISHKTGRMKFSSSVTNATTTTDDIIKASCGICLNLLKKKPYQDEAESSNELSVVAILVCGHVYHGDCLDKKTSEVDKSDPPCPICFESITLPS
ncbi:hypothetical protein C5167_023726 [Papaver somniferum]|uniref:RING-type domain-containing protein n=1 Tax=Papaver somniferum TaxID=3469 RepID=A0A4Y7JPI9_PAPSO|nr:uncharacterized protein LOC113277816 [Papaver somniferum]RZC61960.1 hypothetical protein C5167_023726 [Papaver somniferum]